MTDSHATATTVNSYMSSCQLLEIQ